ncbi:TKFC cyclase, partial [Atractosteus spatula]|nr:TKFC cyclase [Atractosteus spatula]
MQAHRKLVNSVQGCVDEALWGIVSGHGGLTLLEGQRVVLRSDLGALRGRVALVAGGGSGHEPAHAGYIGKGMLSGVVAGAVFASPPPGSVLAAILALWRGGASGVLLIVKNYTGDRLNFGLALEQARAKGVPVSMVIVADDCAFTAPSKAGRRGLCGTVLVHKLAGALAEEGRTLDEIVQKVTEAARGIGTLGVSLSPCSVPGSCPNFELPPGEMELGLGIHGEPGIKRSKVGTADEVVKFMIDHMTDPSSQSHLPLKAGDTVVLVVNNLGSLSCLELAIVKGSAIRYLEERGVCIARVMSGTFMTSLEMAGVSLTLMLANQDILRLFDADTTAPAWPKVSNVTLSGRNRTIGPTQEDTAEPENTTQGPRSAVLRRVLQGVCTSLLAQQEVLNELDRAAGDGDCGNTHALAAQAIQQWLQGHVTPDCPGQLLSSLAGLVQEHMGGSSGALYSLFLTAAAPHLKGKTEPSAWADAVHAGMEAMKRYGGAEQGDRTMLDALCPAVEELSKLSTVPPGGEMEVLQSAVERAVSGAERTRGLTAKAGRASYIAAQRVTQPDPGAVAVATILKAILTALQDEV